MSTFGDAGPLDWGKPITEEDQESPDVDESTSATQPPAAPPATAAPTAPALPSGPGLPVAPPAAAPPVSRQPVGVPKRPVATRPAAPVTPATPPAQPVTPTPAPAPVQAEPTFVQPEPSAPVYAPPVQPQQPPQTPIAPAEPVYAEPVPQPVQQAPVPQPVQQQPAPQPVHQQPQEPVYAQPVQQPAPPAAWPSTPDEQPYWENTPAQPGYQVPGGSPQPPVPDPIADPGVNLDTEPAGRGVRGLMRPKQPREPRVKKAPRERGAKGGAMKGGRGKVIAFRVLAWTVLGVLLLGGIKNVISPNEVVPLSTLSKQVEGKIGTKGFPLAPAAAFASRFTSVYLTFDPVTADERIEALKSYSLEASSSDFMIDTVKRQDVLTGPFLADSEIVDKHNAIITIAAYTSTKKWVYLAVPIYSANLSTFVVSGTPGFVSAPALAVSPERPDQPSTDSDLSDQLTVDLFNGFFKAWGESDTVALTRYTTEKPTANTLTGLRGSVVFSSVEETKIPQGKKAVRTGTVTVIWKSATGSFPQQYRVTIHKGADDRWSIQDVRGGVINTAGTDDAVKPEPTNPTPAP